MSDFSTNNYVITAATDFIRNAQIFKQALF